MNITHEGGRVDLCFIAVEGWVISVHFYSFVVVVDGIEPLMSGESLVARLLQR